MSGARVEEVRRALASRFGADRVEAARPLAPLTTFKVGGPADIFLEPRSSDEIVDALRIAAAHHVPVTMLGGGSNVLIADAGVRGVVLRPRGGHIEREGDRHVRADAAVTINGLVRWLISHGLAGLEAWAGTPGTVGGGIYGNAHWGGRLLSEFVASVRLASPGGDVRDVGAGDMEFGYDKSRLQRTNEVLLSARSPCRPAIRTRCANRRARRWRTASGRSRWRLRAPAASFRTRTRARRCRPECPASAGALIDRAGLKGVRLGGAMVSPTHANFIVNAGTATAAEIRALVTCLPRGGRADLRRHARRRDRVSRDLRARARRTLGVDAAD